MHLLFLSRLATLALSINAVPTSFTYVLHEKRTAEPVQWAKRLRVESDVLLPVRIGLVQSNLDKGPVLLEEVSTPGRSKYGQHYTVEQIHDLFAPSPDTVTAVSEWLHDAGVQQDRISLSVNKQWIQLEASVEEVESLIQTKFYHYEHLGSGRSNIGCDEYHVPKHVSQHIDYITPGLKLLTSSKPEAELEKRTFGVTAPGRKPILLPPKLPLPRPIEVLVDLALEAVCQEAILPKCIKALYNITNPSKAHAGNQLGIFESINDKYSQFDLNEFFLLLAPQIPIGTHPTLNSIDGATAPVPALSVAAAGPESDLDLQISIPLLWPQSTVLYQTDDDVYEANYTFQGFFNNFLDAIDGSYCSYSAFGETGNSQLDPPYPDPQTGGYKGKLQCGVYKPTNVISISYGGQEADLPASYQQRQCNEFMKLGMQGHSIVIASGDSGVGGPAGDDNSNGCLGNAGTIFSPDFPATCPYLTTVGATFLPSGANVNTDQETAVTRFASGGGFSNIYPIPSYQSTAVTNYLAKFPPPYKSYSTTNNINIGAGGGIFNRNGRGYPDVSAIGDNVVIVNAGLPTLIGGTSAAAPVFASVLNRINEERLAQGKSTVGFVNPVLYANPDALHDITNGTNPGCGTNGFSAAKGWDPLTGLGTPDYPKLLDVFMKL